MSNNHEYRTGTNPQDPASCLRARVTVRSPPVVSWPSVAGRTYTLWRATTLRQGMAGFQKIASGIPATEPMNSYADLSAGDGASCYYRVQLDLP